MNEIGKRAGAGRQDAVPALPAREDLILAVYRYDVQSLVDSADQALAAASAADPRPW